MKMKKIFLLFSMIAVFFSLTACGNSQEEVTFEYTDNDIIQYSIVQAYRLQNTDDAYLAYLENSEEEADAVALTAINNMDNAKSECGKFQGYRSKKDGSTIMFDTILNAEDVDAALEELADAVEATVEESNGNVAVTLAAVYKQRDVEYSFVYKENPAYAYAYELYQQSVAPYLVQEVTVTPDYTFGEKMSKAGANTLMGMGTVFIVLIFISLIIGQFERVDRVITKTGIRFGNWRSGLKREKQKATDEIVPKKSTSVPVTSVAANPMDDAQLVAVITAAIAAANGASGGSDQLVVRSIRKAKR